jgi:flagellar motor component MotA
MDPITTAIVAAVAGVSSSAIKDGYNALKEALKKKFGEKSDLVDAVDKLETKPDSEGRKATVQEEVSLAKVNDDPELLKLAQDLLNALKAQPNAQTVINQNVSNVKYAATSGTGPASISNITENQASKDNREDS